MSQKLTIATRKSPLALWQAEFVQKALQRCHPDLEIHIKGMKTKGDTWLQTPLYKIGGKSLFVKELEQALLEKEADIAVHSLKDMPVDLPEGLTLGAVCERESPFDAWVCPKGHHFMNLPPKSIVGTSSLRRQTQLGNMRPDLEYRSLRGNVGTRLNQCLAGEWDAIVLAEAGLLRLGFAQYVTSVFSEEEMLPAVAQGALGIECRANDDNTLALLAPLHHALTKACVDAERAMNRALGGNCHVPVAGFATSKQNSLYLQGLVGNTQDYAIIRAMSEGDSDSPAALGAEVANALLAKGAKSFIEQSSAS